MTATRLAVTLIGLSAVLLQVSYCAGADITLTARIQVDEKDRTAALRQSENVVIWLSPVGERALNLAVPITTPQLVQHDKRFEPHLLVIPVGSLVEFPNRDPFFHNVFSLFEGKRFDLGLYEAGSTRKVRFDKPGISYIFCNIHASMSAIVVALDTPYYAVSNVRGEIVIPHVPMGRYTMQLWYEGALPEILKSLTREVTVSEGTSTLGVLHIPGTNFPTGHLNKYGREYDPVPANPGYDRN